MNGTSEQADPSTQSVVGSETVEPAPRLPTVANVLKIDHFYTIGTDTNAHCHQYYGYTGTPTTAQLNALAVALTTAWVTNLKPIFPSTTQNTGMGVVDLANPANPIGWSPVINSGALATPGITAETALLINLKVNRRYKGGHPRIYLPAGASSYISSPQAWTSSWLSGAATTAWTNWLAAIMAATGGPTLTGPVNVSYYSGKNTVTGKPTPRPTPLVEPIVGWSLNPIPGSQRRRMGR